MAKVIELKPSRKLLNNSFEKYQFTDVVTPIVSYPLSTNIFRKEISSDQNSLLEAHIFAYHNHLFTNNYDKSFWFINDKKQLWKLRDNELKLMYTLQMELKNLIFNPSISFTSNNIIAVLNGNTTLEILIFYNDDNIKNFIFNDIEPGIILDLRYVKEQSMLIVAIQNIVEIDLKKQTEIRLYSYLCKTENNIIQVDAMTRKQIYKVNGTVEYLYIEENGNFFQIACQNELSFHFDSLKSVDVNNDSTIKNSQQEESQEDNIPKYTWSQDEDTISLWIKVAEKLSSMKATINVTLNSIKVSIDNNVLLQGQTPNNLDSNLTTWNRKGDFLEIDLTKQISGVNWDELLIGDKNGEYLPDQTLAAEIHSKLSHLCTEKQENGDGASSIGFNSEQLEECDLEGRENLMQRINISTHEKTHFAILRQSNCILFNQKLKNKQVVGLRHDHAGCVWIFGSGDEENWQMEHRFTFPGYGYIEASKKNKKFSFCAPDGSYVAILEHLRHIFIYEKPEENAQVSKQRIVDLDTESPILGAGVINNDLFVLTTNVLYKIQVF